MSRAITKTEVRYGLFDGRFHGNPDKILNIYEKVNPTEEDVIIILSDAVLNFHLNECGRLAKQFLSYIKPIFFCIHGNNDACPATIPLYKLIDYRDDQV